MNTSLCLLNGVILLNALSGVVLFLALESL